MGSTTSTDLLLDGQTVVDGASPPFVVVVTKQQQFHMYFEYGTSEVLPPGPFLLQKIAVHVGVQRKFDPFD
jgi:hypothetical protein